MAKTFITSGTGASQTLDAIQNEKVPVYNTRADAEADIANIEEGAIVATKDTGATEKVVDVVEDGNMNPVTSNAVYDALSNMQEATFITSSTYTSGSIFYAKQGHVVTVTGWAYAPNAVSAGRVIIANVPTVIGANLALFTTQNTTTGNLIPSVELINNELSIYMSSTGDAGYVRFNGSYLTSE